MDAKQATFWTVGRGNRPEGRYDGRHSNICRRLSWLRTYPHDVHWAEDLPPGPLFKALDGAVASFPQSAAIDFLGKDYSYEDVDHLVRRAAKGLQRLGVGKGTRVGLFLPNCPYWVIMYYVILRIGGVVVNYSPLCVERELAHQVEDSGTRFMFALDLACVTPKRTPSSTARRWRRCHRPYVRSPAV